MHITHALCTHPMPADATQHIVYMFYYKLILCLTTRSRSQKLHRNIVSIGKKITDGETHGGKQKMKSHSHIFDTLLAQQRWLADQRYPRANYSVNRIFSVFILVFSSILNVAMETLTNRSKVLLVAGEN